MPIVQIHTHNDCDSFFKFIDDQFLNNRKVKQVDSGEFHTILALNDGSLYGFGSGDDGRLGVNSSGAKTDTTPVQINFFEKNNNVDVIQFSCGGYHSVFLDAHGFVYVCGKTTEGACGFSTNTDALLVPKKWDSMEHAEISGKVKKVQAGGHQTICLTADGQVWTCGQNFLAQCGRAQNTDRLMTPGQVSFDHLGNDIAIDDITSAYYHTVCLMKHTQSSPQRIFVFGNYVSSAKLYSPIEIELPFQSTIYQMSAGIQFTSFSLLNGQHYTLLDNVHDYSKWPQGGIDQTDKTSLRGTTMSQAFKKETNLHTLACGYYHTTILTTDGRVILYGKNLMITDLCVLDASSYFSTRFSSTTSLRFGLACSGHMRTVTITADLCDGGLKWFGLFMFENLRQFATHNNLYCDIDIVTVK